MERLVEGYLVPNNAQVNDVGRGFEFVVLKYQGLTTITPSLHHIDFLQNVRKSAFYPTINGEHVPYSANYFRTEISNFFDR